MKNFFDNIQSANFISVSLCVNEKITKEKLETLDKFLKRYEKIFKEQ